MKIIALLPLILLTTPLHAQAKSDTIKMSAYQRADLLTLQVQMNDLTKQQNAILRTLIAGVRDPSTVADWTIQLTDSTVILSPPKPRVSADSVPPHPKKP